MNAVIVGLLGALIGAAAILMSGLLVESYKRHRDRQSAASAMAGEVATLLAMAAWRKHAEFFKAIKAQIDAGQNVDIPNIMGEGRLDPVAEKHIDRLGLLSENRLPERIVTFYSKLREVHIDVVNLSRGAWDHDLQAKANIIGEDLALWAETVTLGTALSDELRRIALEPWWLARAWMSVSAPVCRLWTHLTARRERLGT